MRGNENYKKGPGAVMRGRNYRRVVRGGGRCGLGGGEAIKGEAKGKKGSGG